MKNKFSELNEATPEELFLHELEKYKIPREDAAWISAFICRSIDEPDSLETLPMAIGNIYSRYGESRNGALSALLFGLARIGGIQYVYTYDNEPMLFDEVALAEEWRVHTIDFKDGLLYLSQSQDRNAHDIIAYGKYLVKNGLIDGPFLSTEEVIDFAAQGTWSWSAGVTDLKDPLSWFGIYPRNDIAPEICRMIDSAQDSKVGLLARAWEAILRITVSTPIFGKERFPHEGTHEENALIMADIFPALDAKVSANREDRVLQGMWFRYGNFALEVKPQNVSANARQELKKSSDKLMGYIRRLGREAKEKGDEAAEEFRKTYVSDAAETLVRTSSLLAGEKALIRALRALSVPSVNDDMRYWKENRLDPPPEPWNLIPELMTSLFHVFAKKELAGDPKLGTFRTDLCRFLLDNLKTKARHEDGGSVSNDDFVETDPIWRYAYIRAARDLKVNPEGKGHHILYWLSGNDPDDDVKSAAKTAYKEMRHDAVLPPRTSPRRAVLAAFAWLRQGHLLSLGLNVDPDGARRTRGKEVRRSQEIERED